MTSALAILCSINAAHAATANPEGAEQRRLNRRLWHMFVWGILGSVLHAFT